MQTEAAGSCAISLPQEAALHSSDCFGLRHHPTGTHSRGSSARFHPPCGCASLSQQSRTPCPAPPRDRGSPAGCSGHPGCQGAARQLSGTCRGRQRLLRRASAAKSSSLEHFSAAPHGAGAALWPGQGREGPFVPGGCPAPAPLSLALSGCEMELPAAPLPSALAAPLLPERQPRLHHLLQRF